MAFVDPNSPYNELPPLPPSAEIETHDVLKLCIEARTQLAEMAERSRQLPNPSILINTIPLLEAQASSEIENIVTTSDQLFRAADASDQNIDPATKEALRYRTALYEGYSSLVTHPVGTNTAVRVCRTIKNTEIDIRRTPGTQLINNIVAHLERNSSIT